MPWGLFLFSGQIRGNELSRGQIVPLRRISGVNLSGGISKYLFAAVPAIVCALLVLTSSPAKSSCLSPLGDLNASGATDVTDVQCSIILVLSQLSAETETPPPDCLVVSLSEADLDCNEAWNVADVILVIFDALGVPLAVEIDANADGCPDACSPACTDGAAPCAPCAPGFVFSEGSKECTACPPGSFDDGTEVCAPCPEDFTSESGGTECVVAKVEGYLGVRDYGYLFWPTNHWFQWNVFFNEQHVQTGHYGLAIDVSTATLTHLGLIEEEVSPNAALVQGKSVIDDLPGANVTYSVIQAGVESEANAFLNDKDSAQNPSRLIEMGRFMQRIEIPKVLYADSPELSGSIQLAAMPRHFVLTHRVINGLQSGPLTLTLTLSAEALGGLEQVTWLEEDRALSVQNENGAGWSFIIPELPGAAPEISAGEDGSLVFTNTYAAPAAGQQLTLPVIGVPSNAGGAEQLSLWLHPDVSAQVQYAQLNLDGSGGEALTDASWDPERGVYVIGLKNLSEVGAPGWQNWADLNIHNWYNRHRLVLHNDTDAKISIPLAFEGGENAAFYIVGGSPLFRDLDQEPIGAPIQISKNWHETPAWYHLYSALDLDPGTHELEHTFAHAKWGDAYAAAHAQLSLIGYGQNQQWDESSLGAFGESITYDPDWTLGRAMVDDVRPFLVESEDKWSWTGNVGGADFLVYADSPQESFPGHQLGRLRTHYRYTGPNLTDVIYAGISRDEKIEARISTQLGRTNDLIRAYYHLEYTFLADVTYDRLALFQVAADRYADNGFTRYAYGNESGVAFDALIVDHQTTGYAAESDRGIPMPGESPWVMLYDSEHTSGNLPEHLANIGFVIRSYEAVIGETVYTTPHINITQTHDGAWSQMAFQLGIPYDSANPVVPAGSVLKATVEYLIPPAEKSAYYGESDYLTELDAESYQSTDMMLLLADGNQLTVEASTGTVTRVHPVELAASAEPTAVQFTLTGGLGYTPVSIHGLPRSDGWEFQQNIAGAWLPLSQEVHGKDYWQAYFDAESGSYDLVFNVLNQGTKEYRLVRAGTVSCGSDEGSFSCGCAEGYTAVGEELSCEDINECEVGQDSCTQSCSNTVGGFVCSCESGYVLSLDGASCDDVDE